MPWVRFDDRFPSNRKISLLSDRAFRLYVSAVCWSAENLTDGVILDEELTLVAHVRNINGARNELESRGLWERIAGGWRIHDYHEYQPTRQRVMEDRARNAARQEAFRERKRAKQDAASPAPAPPSNASSNSVTNGVSHGGSNSAPSRPDPVLPTEVQREGARASETAALKTPAPPRPDGRTPIPDDFALSDAMRRWAAATFPGLDPDYETQQFISHHRAEGSRRRSWPDEWQKWMRRSARYASERANRQLPLLAALPGGADRGLAARQASREFLDQLGDQLRQERQAQEGHSA